MNGGATMIRRAFPMLVLAVAAACGSNGNGPSGGTGGSSGGAGGGAGNGASGGGGGTAGGTGGGAPGGTGGGSAGGTGGGGPGGTGGGASGFISTQYPRDVAIASDARVLFASDFESGLAGWTSYTNNTDQIAVLTDGSWRTRAPGICARR